MEKNRIRDFINNVDGWIKEFDTDMCDTKQAVIENQILINENIDNTQHNYELIYELKDQIAELKQEINALKLVQIISLKKVR